jgi:hypothetical protein
VLCLFTQAGGWQARPTGGGPAPGLWPGTRQRTDRAGRGAPPASDRRRQPALAA